MEPLPLEDAPPRRPKSRLWPKLVLAFLCLALALATFLGMRYRDGAVPDFAFREFNAPDGTFKLLLVGEPSASTADYPPGFATIQRGSEYRSQHWSTPISTSLRYYEIEPGTETSIRPEDLFANEIAQRAKQLNAKVEMEAAVKWNEYQGREAVFVNGRTRIVERYLFVNRPTRPRLYALSIGGSGLKADSETVTKFMGSFRLK